MNLSLNEVEAMSKRAARGAGYSWGLAEEAAKATRWLCANNLPGAETLLKLLQRTDGTPIATLSPRSAAFPWSGDAGYLCPLAVGASLTDFAHRIADEQVVLEDVATPLLLLPFAAQAARQISAPISIVCTAYTATTDGRSLAITTNDVADITSRVKISIADHVPSPIEGQSRAVVGDDIWDALGQFAHRTYAPATEASRLLGAGAGLSDND